MKWAQIVLVTVALGCCQADTVVLNQLMDQVLDSVRLVITQGGMDHLKIPDMDNGWHYRWHHIKLSGKASCHDGEVGSLASIRRTGDTTLQTVGNKAILNVKLGLGELNFHFGRCRFKAKHLFSVSSKLKAKVRSNSIDLQVSLTGQGAQCVASLDHVILNQFGGLDINTGGGIIHKIEDKILSWVAKHFHDKVVNIVNAKLADVVNKSLPKMDLCSRIPH